jgi:hypothetical protein
MKSLTRIGSLMSCGLFALSIASALAFDCPNTQKAVMAYCDKTAKVSGVDQVKLTQAKTMLDETMKKHEADNHQGAMTEMAEAMTLITHARSQPPISRGLAVAPCFIRIVNCLTFARAQDTRLPGSFLPHNRGANPQFPHLSSQWLQPPQPHAIFLSGD